MYLTKAIKILDKFLPSSPSDDTVRNIYIVGKELVATDSDYVIKLEVEEMEGVIGKVISLDNLKSVQNLKQVNQVIAGDNYLEVKGSIDLKIDYEPEGDFLYDMLHRAKGNKKFVGNIPMILDYDITYYPSKDISRACLTTIHHDAIKREACATDGHKLKIQHLPQMSISRNINIPANLYLHFAKEKVHSIRAYYEMCTSWVELSACDIKIFYNQRALEPYPDYTKCVPTDFHRSNLIHKDFLLEPLKEIKKFVNKKTKLVKIEQDYGYTKLVFSAKAHAGRKSGVEAHHYAHFQNMDLPSYALGYNVEYLIKMLEQMNKTGHSIRWNISNTQIAPTTFVDYEQDSVSLIMPLKILED